MRLTEPGIYVARDGRVAMSYTPWFSDKFVYWIRDIAGHAQQISPGVAETEGEWQRIDAVWPELPPKPPQVYAVQPTRVLNDYITVYMDPNPVPKPQWWTISRCTPRTAWSGGICFGIQQLTVIPHPDNDPEAVAMIEAAKEGRDAD